MAQIDQIQTDLDRLLIDVDRLKNTTTNPESVIKEYIPDISDLNVLNNDLDTLNGSLDDLAMDLYGDESHEGLVGYLNELQVQLYGKGQTYTKDGVVHNCTITDPCPDSLKGRLNTLRTNLDDLSLANAELKKSLKALTDDLTNFTGTFAQFKQSLEAQGIHYDSLDASIQALLHSVYNTFQAIDVVDGRVDDVNDTLGDPADTTNTSVFGKINNTNVAVDNVSEQADKVEGRMYAGWDESTGTKGTGTITQPATGTVKKNLDKAKEDIGTVNPTADGSLQQQITYLPSYISNLYVRQGSVTNGTTINKNESVTIGGDISELARKTIRDTGSISFTIKITFPENHTYSKDILVSSPNIISMGHVFGAGFFNEDGLYIVSCEHLKCVFKVGNYAKSSHTHSLSEITDIDRSIPIWTNRNLYDPEQIYVNKSNNVVVVDGNDSSILTDVSVNGALLLGKVSPPPTHEINSRWFTQTNSHGRLKIDTNGNVLLINDTSSKIDAYTSISFNFTYIIPSLISHKLTEMTISKSITQTNDTLTMSAKLIYNDGTPVQGEKVYFYYDDGT